MREPFEVPDFLIDRLRRRRCVLCAGLGLGRAAGLAFPTWSWLAGQLADWVRAEQKTPDDIPPAELQAAVTGGDLFTVVGYLTRCLGRDTVIARLRDAYPGVPALPALYHALGRLPFRGLVATGYDTVIGRPFGTDDDEGPPIFTHLDGAALRAHRGLFYLAAHGELSRPTTLVLGRGDLRRAVSEPDYAAFCRELFNRYSLVFVGYAPDDPDFLALLERHFGGAPRALLPHVLLADDVNPLVARELRAAHGVVVVPVGGDLAGFVAALADRVASAEAEARPDLDDLAGWLKVLHADPGDTGAWEALAGIEAGLREAHDAPQLVELLLGRLDLERRPAERRRLLREVAHLFETRLDDPSRALTALLACLREDPDDLGVLDALERLAARTNRWGEVVTDYAEMLGGALGPSAAPGWVRLGRLYEHKLEQLDYALAAYERALALDPRLAPAQEARLGVLRRAGRWRSLADALEAELRTTTDPARQGELWVTLADIHETRLDDPVQAVAAYQRALELEPESPEILAALERVLRRLGHWRDLCDVLTRRARLSHDAEAAAALWHEIGVVRATHLEDRAGATAIFEELLERHPDHLETLAALERLHQERGDLAEATRVLERMIAVVPDRDGRRTLLARLAARHREQGDRGGELAAVEALRALTPDDPEILESLARLLGAAERHAEEAEVRSRLISLAPTPERRREHLLALARLAESELGDLPRATQAYEELAAGAATSAPGAPLDPVVDSALAALVRLYERQGKYARVAETALRRAAGHSDAATRAELIAIAGVMAAEHLDDLDAAETHFAQALELDDRHLPARLGLIGVYRRRGSYLRAARLLDESAAHTQNRLQKTRFLFEAGCLYADHLDDPERAARSFHEVLEIDPEHVETATRLVDHYTRLEEWAPLEPILEMLVRRAGQRGPAERVPYLVQLGTTCRELGNFERALRHFHAARALAPTDRDVLAGLGELLFARISQTATVGAPLDDAAREDARHAVDYLQTLLVNHGESLGDSERLAVLQRLGQLHLLLGQPERALGRFDAALALEPQDRVSLEGCLSVVQERRDWPRVADLLERLVELVPATEQGRLLERLGDVYLDQLEDPVESARAYEAAARSSSRRRAALTKLMDLYSQQKAWERAIEVIGALCQLEEHGAARAQHYFTAALIAENQLDDEERALRYYDDALASDPTDLRPLDEVARVLSGRGDFDALARAYGRHLKRMPAQGHEAARRDLWARLGEVCLTHLDRRDDALAAFEVVASLAPDDVTHQERLARLYLESGAAGHERAIAAYQQQVRRAPEQPGAYHQLFRLYRDSAQPDRAFAVAAALVVLDAADDDERATYQAGLPAEPAPPAATLTEELWLKAVLHPDEDRFVGALFSRLGNVVALLRAKEPEAFGLKRRDRVDSASDQRPVAQLFRQACQTLAVTPPDLYLRNGAAWSVQVANTAEKTLVRPALVIGHGGGAGPTPRVMLFDLGSLLAFTRPERYLRYALPAARDVEAAFRGMLLALGLEPPPAAASDPTEAELYAEEITRVTATPVLEPLASAARKWRDAHDSFDAGAWIAAADLTATRAGLIACRDLETAALSLAAATGAGRAPASEPAVRRLLVYAVSDEYAAVRRHLGVAVT